MLDGLTFLHCLHDVLLDHSLDAGRNSLARRLRSSVPVRTGTPQINRLETGNVLCLKALGAFLHFELHRLTFIEGLVAVHHDCGEVHENILSCLTLDEAVALRCVKPLHCSLFLHRHYLSLRATAPVSTTWSSQTRSTLGIALLLLIRSWRPQNPLSQAP